MEQIKLTIVFLVFFLLVVFAVYNRTDVSINIFTWSTPPLPLIVIVFGSVFLGAVTSALLGILTQIKLKNVINRKEKDIKDVKDKLVKLDLKLRNYEEKDDSQKNEKEGKKRGISNDEVK